MTQEIPSRAGGTKISRWRLFLKLPRLKKTCRWKFLLTAGLKMLHQNRK